MNILKVIIDGLSSSNFCNDFDIDTGNIFDRNFQKRFLELDINTFEKSYTKFGGIIFVLACKYNYKDKIKFLIEKKFGLDYITPERITGFMHLCYHNNHESINLLMN